MDELDLELKEVRIEEVSSLVTDWAISILHLHPDDREREVWFRLFLEEVREAKDAYYFNHPDPLEDELLDVAAIVINWLATMDVAVVERALERIKAKHAIYASPVP